MLLRESNLKNTPSSLSTASLSQLGDHMGFRECALFIGRAVSRWQSKEKDAQFHSPPFRPSLRQHQLSKTAGSTTSQYQYLFVFPLVVFTYCWLFKWHHNIWTRCNGVLIVACHTFIFAEVAARFRAQNTMFIKKYI